MTEVVGVVNHLLPAWRFRLRPVAYAASTR